MACCNICGKQFKKVTESHLKKAHQISAREYKELFPGVAMSDPESEETRMKKSQGKIGKKHTEEARQKMSESRRGSIPWNVGLTGTTNTKLSETLKEKYKDLERAPKASEFIGPKQKKQRAKQSEESKQKRAKAVSGDNNGARIKSRRRLEELCEEHNLKIGFLENGSYGLTCLNCGTYFTRTKSVLTPYRMSNSDYGEKICPTCYPRTYNKSQKEHEIVEFLKSIYDGEIICGSRDLIKPYEIDIYIPEFKLGIEFDGIYWHSEQVLKDRNKSLTKVKLARENNIRLLTIFEDEWDYKQIIVKSRLQHILGEHQVRIYARKCVIREISGSAKREFLDAYHIQGADRSKISLGAFFEDSLVAVMTFSPSSFVKGGNGSITELNRFATKDGITVVGAASKLLSYYRKNYSDGPIISYSDNRWSDGNLYVQLGFEFASESPPSYFYFKRGECKRLHRSNFMKHMLNAKLDVFDPNLTEYENMLANGYDRIWDCGTKKWLLK